jgi:hypothetical protein
MKTPPSLGPTGRLETVCVGDNPVMIIVHIRRLSLDLMRFSGGRTALCLAHMAAENDRAPHLAVCG